MKLSITSNRPQTTRHRIIGILTEADAQLVFVDTPGFQTDHGGALNKLMNRAVTESLRGVDVVLFVIEAMQFGRDDRKLLPLLPKDIPVVLVVNKVDSWPRTRAVLLPFIAEMSKALRIRRGSSRSARPRERRSPTLREPSSPICRKARACTARTKSRIVRSAFSPPSWCAKNCSGCSARNCLTRRPSWSRNSRREGRLRRIHAAIVVDKPNHKAIVIGKGGAEAQGDRHPGAPRHGETVRRQGLSRTLGAGEERLGGQPQDAEESGYD